MKSATATRRTVASRCRRKTRPAFLRTAAPPFPARGCCGGDPAVAGLCWAVSPTKIHLRSRSAAPSRPTRFHGTRPGRTSGFAPAANAAVDQVLVVAIGFLIAPVGRLMYFCAVVLPWNRLDATYGATLSFVTTDRPVSVFGGTRTPPERLYMYMYSTGRNPWR